jgi:nucleoside-diphosphate-sugar epimerase
MSETDLDPRTSRVYVAGHNGMVGRAIVRRLESLGYENLLLRTSAELDLRRQEPTEAFFRAERPEYVFIAAARVGGILANQTYPADFIYDNLLIAANVIHAAFAAGTRRCVFLGSSCIYPREAPQPMAEEALLTGTLEPTNEPYAIAKIAGIKLCESYNRQHGTDYRSLMPTNLYGPWDNFDPETSHVLPALIHRFHVAKVNDVPEVELWGTGSPRREFMHVDDLAAASEFVMRMPAETYRSVTRPMLSHLNVGTGSDLTIRELAEKVRDIVGYRGAIRFNSAYPDGTPRKLLDVGRLARLGWQARIGLDEGIRSTYDWYAENVANA